MNEKNLLDQFSKAKDGPVVYMTEDKDGPRPVSIGELYFVMDDIFDASTGALLTLKSSDDPTRLLIVRLALEYIISLCGDAVINADASGRGFRFKDGCIVMDELPQHNGSTQVWA